MIYDDKSPNATQNTSIFVYMQKENEPSIRSWKYGEER